MYHSELVVWLLLMISLLSAVYTMASLYRSTSLVREIKSGRLRWAGHVVRMEKGRSAFKILTSKPTSRKVTFRNGRTMDLKEVGISINNLVDSSQDRYYWRTLVNAALNLRVP